MKRIKALIACGVLLSMLVGCAPVGVNTVPVAPENAEGSAEEAAVTGSEAETSAEPQKLTMGIWGIESVVKAHEIACEGIHEAIPEISEMELIVYPTADEFFATLPTQIASGTAPDIVKCDYTYMYEYIDKGYFIPLDESVLDLSPYTKEGVDVFRVDGQLYGIPINAQPFCICINLDLWHEAGLTDIPETYEDYLAAGEKFAELGKPLWIFENGIVYINSVLQSFGGSWNRGENITNDTNVEAFDALIDLFRKGYAVTPESLGVADASTAFTQGQAPLITAGPWYNSVVAAGAPDMNYALIKWPAKSEETRGFMPTIDGYFIVNGADPALCSKALNHVDRKEFQEAFYNGVGAMMSNLEVREFYFDKYPAAENLKDAMQYIQDPMFPAEASEFAGIVTTELGKAINDPSSTITGKDFLENVDKQFNN